jgi:hypothetical protein
MAFPRLPPSFIRVEVWKDWWQVKSLLLRVFVFCFCLFVVIIVFPEHKFFAVLLSLSVEFWVFNKCLQPCHTHLENFFHSRRSLHASYCAIRLLEANMAWMSTSLV